MTTVLARLTALLMLLSALSAATAADRYAACQFNAAAPLTETPLGAVGIADATSQGCVEHPLEWDKATAKERMEHFRVAAGEPAKEKRVWGVALSGGGSKAAPAAVGVLAGLYDIGLLDRLSYISSVSGGSYGAYFLYSRFLNDPEAKSGNERRRLQDAFLDCYRATNVLRVQPPHDLGDICNKLAIRSSPVADRPEREKDYNLVGDGKHSVFNLEQAWLRCSQDVLEPHDCSFSGTTTDTMGAGATATGLLLASILSAPLHHAVNSVFDWGVNLSPSRYVYTTGIGVSFGTTPASATFIDPPGKCIDEETRFAPCKRASELMPVPRHSFEELARVTKTHALPTWIINATAVPHRSVFGWLGEPKRDFMRDSFEFTPHSFGSARFGFVNRPRSDFTVLDAVVASAAFFDANQIAAESGRPVLAVAQHLFNANWGVDIVNWNTSETRRRVHQALPFPLYYLDGFAASTTAANSTDDPDLRSERISRVRSTFIRLVDGGSADNTGAYALVRRDVKNIIIVDGAQDKGSEFSDLAMLCREVYRHHGLYLVFPHVEGLSSFATERVPGKPAVPACRPLPARPTYQDWMRPTTHDDDRKNGIGLIYRWPAPIIYGCLTKTPEHECRSDVTNRILLLKPALDALSVHRRARCTRDPDGIRAACVRKLVGHTRTGQAPMHWSQQPLPCEPTFFVKSNYTDSEFSDFPQDSTVVTTMNSSHTKFSAYRDLMRFYAQYLPGQIPGMEPQYSDVEFGADLAMQAERSRGHQAPKLPRSNDAFNRGGGQRNNAFPAPAPNC